MDESAVKQASNGSSGGELQCSCGSIATKCFVYPRYYLTSCWLWTKLIIFGIIYAGAIFGITLLKGGGIGGEVHFKSYHVLGEIIVTSIMCNLVPFALLRFGLPWAYHGDHFIGRFLRPIHPSYFTESPWRYVGGRILLLSHYWTVVLSACVFTLVVFALPFIIILGIVLDGNTKPMDTGVWAGIMAAWGAFVHTCAFVTALLWNAAHRLRPLCEREKLIQTKRAEKAAKKQGTGTTQPACNSLEGYAKDTAEGAMGVAPGPLEERDGSVRITMSIRDTDDKKLPIISVPPAAVSPQSV